MRSSICIACLALVFGSSNVARAQGSSGAVTPQTASSSAAAPKATAHLQVPSAASVIATAVPSDLTAPTSPQPASTDLELGGCRDDWPSDRARPQLVETFPKRGVAGHVARLDLLVEHFPGELVFPAGLETMQMMIGESSDERALLSEAQFKVPDPKSEVKPTLQRPDPKGTGRVKTQLSFPFIALPKQAGRFELTLPRLPISVARASGQVHTICTQPHVITVEDPLASQAQAEKKPDPELRSQIEVWTALRDFVLHAAWVVPLVLLMGWLLYHYRDRFRKKPVPPPPIPPWERARGQLSHLEAKGLLQAGAFEEYLDGVTDTLREYLGFRYGFDGLECTTRELLRQLGGRASDFSEEQSVRTLLQRADLVKFARRAPTEEECREAMQAARRIIDVTTPAPSLDPRSPSGVVAPVSRTARGEVRRPDSEQRRPGSPRSRHEEER